MYDRDRADGVWKKDAYAHVENNSIEVVAPSMSGKHGFRICHIGCGNAPLPGFAWTRKARVTGEKRKKQ